MKQVDSGRGAWMLVVVSIVTLVGGTFILFHPSNSIHTLLLPLVSLPILAMIHWVALQIYLYN